MNIPTLQSKLDAIGYNEALETEKSQKNATTLQYEKAQDKLAEALRARGIAPEDFYFNPQDSYIRLADHSERRLHSGTWMCLDMVRSTDTAMAMSLQGIRFESKRYIQNVVPEEQNVIICAETLEYFAELMRAFDEKELVQEYIDIINEYWGYLLSSAKANKKNYDVVKLGKQYIAAADYATKVLMPCGIDTVEDMKEYFGSIHGAELQDMWEQMGSPGTYSSKSEELRKVIYEFFLVDETKL